jgi:O-antigen/teichoic acid export membrane protein
MVIGCNEGSTPSTVAQRGRLGFLLKDSATYGASAAISKAFAFVTFPLIVRHFSVAEFGVLDYFIALSGFLVTFFIFGQDSAVGRFFYEYQDIDQRKQVISQSLLFQLGGLGLFLPLFWVISEWLATFLIGAPDSVLFLKIVLLQSPFQLLINFSQNILKWTFARTRFLIMSVGFAITQASLLVVAVGVFGVGIQGVLLVTLITSLMFGILGVIFVRKWLAFPTDFKRLREMMPYALPYGLICMATAISPTLERSLTNAQLGADELGLYAAGTKVAMLMGLLVTAFQTAWGPFSLSIHKEADAIHSFNLVFKLFALGTCAAALILTLLAQPLILLLATDRYRGATVVVFPLVLGLAIQGASWITEIGIGISKQSYLNLYAYGIAIAATLSGILLFVPMFGLLGVALGVLLGHISKAFVASVLAQRAHPLPWSYAGVIAVFGLTLILGLSAIRLGQSLGNLPYLISLVVALMVVGAAGWRILFNQTERKVLTEFLSRKCFGKGIF